MKSETLEQQAEYWTNKFFEFSNEGVTRYIFASDAEPSSELRILIEKILRENNYRAEFQRPHGERLSITFPKNRDDEQDESNNTDGW